VYQTEITIEVSFSRQEKTEYQKIENSARDFYVDFRDVKGDKITKHYLKLTQKLAPLRVACAGGKYPLPSSVGEVGDAGVGDSLACDDEAEGGVSTKKAARGSSVNFSDFVFTSKLNVLIAELEKIRDTDPSCE
jgi:hypothetical protein